MNWDRFHVVNNLYTQIRVYLIGSIPRKTKNFNLIALTVVLNHPWVCWKKLKQI